MHTLDTRPVHTSVKPHLYDAWGRPAPDYWVCQLLLCDQLASEAEKAATEGHYLVSWIPPGKFPQADRELKQFGYEHNVWLDKAPACLLQHFEDRHLISVL